MLYFEHNQMAMFFASIVVMMPVVLTAASRGARMLQVLQINFALWGMLLCLALKASQWIEYAF